MLLHNLWKVKVQICGKLRTRWTFNRFVMVSVGISKLGLMDLIFVHQGWRSAAAATATCSCHSSCCPWCATCKMISLSFNKTCSAPAHRARDTVRFLEQWTPAFILPDLWPPNSTDLSPVDYKICGDIQQWVYQSQLHSIDELKKRLLDVWHGMDQSVIDDVIDGWRIRAKGGHFKHCCKLDNSVSAEPYDKR